MSTKDERLGFFNANVDDVHNAIEGANARRAARRLPPLTEDEVDAGIDEMIALKREGKPIADYDFKIPHGMAEKPSQVTAQGIQGDKFSFDVIKCANGFLMNMTQDGAAKTFIFKTQVELGDIFNDVLFSEGKNGREERSEDSGGEAKKPRRVTRADVSESRAGSA